MRIIEFRKAELLVTLVILMLVFYGVPTLATQSDDSCPSELDAAIGGSCEYIAGLFETGQLRVDSGIPNAPATVQISAQGIVTIYTTVFPSTGTQLPPEYEEYRINMANTVVSGDKSVLYIHCIYGDCINTINSPEKYSKIGIVIATPEQQIRRIYTAFEHISQTFCRDSLCK